MPSLSPGKWMLILVPVAAGLLLLAAACGGDDDDGGNGGNGGNGNGGAATPAHEIESQPVSPQAIGDEVTEASGGALQTAVGDNFYTLNNLKVPLNETTAISITNDGLVPHNMRIAGPDGEWSTDDDSASAPEILVSGTTGVVEFTPTLAGTYTFRCDIHPTEQGGIIVVG